MGTTGILILPLAKLADLILTQMDSCPFGWVSLIYTLLRRSLVCSLAAAVTRSLNLSFCRSWRLGIWCHGHSFPALIPEALSKSRSLGAHSLKSSRLVLKPEESPRVWCFCIAEADDVCIDLKPAEEGGNAAEGSRQSHDSRTGACCWRSAYDEEDSDKLPLKIGTSRKYLAWAARGEEMSRWFEDEEGIF